MGGELVDQIPKRLRQILPEVVIGVVQGHQIGDHHPVSLRHLGVRPSRQHWPEQQCERTRYDYPDA